MSARPPSVPSVLPAILEHGSLESYQWLERAASDASDPSSRAIPVVDFSCFMCVQDPMTDDAAVPLHRLQTFLEEHPKVAASIRMLTLEIRAGPGARALSWPVLLCILVQTTEVQKLRLIGWEWDCSTQVGVPRAGSKLEHLWLEKIAPSSDGGYVFDLLNMATSWVSITLVDAAQATPIRRDRAIHAVRLYLRRRDKAKSSDDFPPDLSGAIISLDGLNITGIEAGQEASMRSLFEGWRQTMREVKISFSLRRAEEAIPSHAWVSNALSSCRQLRTAAFEFPTGEICEDMDCGGPPSCVSCCEQKTLSVRVVRVLRTLPSACTTVGIRLVLSTQSPLAAEESVAGVDWNAVGHALEHVEGLELFYCEVTDAERSRFAWEEDVGPQLQVPLQGMRKADRDSRWWVCGFTSMAEKGTIIFRRKDNEQYGQTRLRISYPFIGL